MRRTPLRRTLRRHEPVTSALWWAVVRRDGGCVAALLDREHACTNAWGEPARRDDPTALTVDHVREQPGGKRPSDMAHCVALCWGAHILSGWATSHRPELRTYLARVAA